MCILVNSCNLSCKVCTYGRIASCTLVFHNLSESLCLSHMQQRPSQSAKQNCPVMIAGGGFVFRPEYAHYSFIF